MGNKINESCLYLFLVFLASSVYSFDPIRRKLISSSKQITGERRLYNVPQSCRYNRVPARCRPTLIMWCKQHHQLMKQYKYAFFKTRIQKRNELKTLMKHRLSDAGCRGYSIYR